MNLLHFDVEGGWGGSSISLFEITKKLKKTKHKIIPAVLHKIRLFQIVGSALRLLHALAIIPRRYPLRVKGELHFMLYSAKQPRC